MAAIMASMMEPGEDAASVAALSPDAMLIRWVNYHLKNSGTDRRIENFSSDIQDGVVYTYLLKEICPSEVDGVDLRGLSSVCVLSVDACSPSHSLMRALVQKSASRTQTRWAAASLFAHRTS